MGNRRKLMTEPSREEVDQITGLVLLEFGAEWCPHCQAVRPFLDEMLSQMPEVQHIRVEDGRGKPLGRSFRVKLWPTLVFLRNGQVVSRLVRPSSEEIASAFSDLETHGTSEGPTA
jgi:thioredoxin 1